MALSKAVVYDGGLQRQVQQGDLVGFSESIPATLTANSLTVTGQILGQPIVQRTPTGTATSTIDTATNIVAALSTSPFGLQSGLSWRVRWIGRAAFVDTLTAAANTGIGVTAGVVNASSVKDFLVTVVNGSPGATLSGTTVNGSAVISGFTTLQLAYITPGMLVTNAVAGLAGATVISVNLTAGTITMGSNANATNTAPVAISFTPVINIDGIGQMLL